jgi:hypothetical protein
MADKVNLTEVIENLRALLGLIRTGLPGSDADRKAAKLQERLAVAVTMITMDLSEAQASSDGVMNGEALEAIVAIRLDVIELSNTVINYHG